MLRSLWNWPLKRCF
uniref:Uncharacterized protein n=1 Tax=Salix viminalis TaxID=40686 RepID=A0A6N2MFG7_SALVM